LYGHNNNHKHYLICAGMGKVIKLLQQ